MAKPHLPHSENLLGTDLGTVFTEEKTTIEMLEAANLEWLECSS
jgi:hypothetical protein